MKGYGQFCPVAKAAEIVAERWTPLILRELMCGSSRFNDIQRGVPLMSPSLLSQRLKTLERAGIVVRSRGPGTGFSYRLTAAGRELQPLIEGLGVWGRRWVRSQLHDDDLDPALLMWDIQRRIDLDALPPRRVLVQFEFARATRGRRRWWLLGDRTGIGLCLTDPGHTVDLFVTTDVRTLTQVWLGEVSMAGAVAGGAIDLHGPSELCAAFPSWLRLSTFAGIEAAAAAT
jgi:DNA-binding HxlR family transcriptional regulator